MNKNLELFVNGTNDTVGQIELYPDEVISLNISIADIMDITKRNSTFSQNFTIPASKNNNILLNHIFNIGADATFDPRKKTPSYLTIDTIPIFIGNMQLLNIKTFNGVATTYEIIVYGETIDLYKSMGSSLLTDLDFSELNHNRDAQTVVNSWYADTKSLGYYYPLIDYGYDLDISEINSGVLLTSILTGNVSSGTITSITDTTQSFTTNSLVGKKISIISGTAAGEVRTIFSNTGITIVTVGAAYPVAPDNTSVYSIGVIDSTNPYNSSGNGMNPALFKPALSNTYLFKKILSNIGFIADGTFIDSDVLGETIIPFNGQDNSLKEEDEKTFKAFSEDYALSHIYTGAGTFDPTPFNFSDDDRRGYDLTNSYDPLTNYYTSPANNIVSQFALNLSYHYNQTYYTYYPPVPGQINSEMDRITVKWYRSSLAVGYDYNLLFPGSGTPNLYAQCWYDIPKVPNPNQSVYPYGLQPPNGSAMDNKNLVITAPILDGVTPAPGITTPLAQSNGGILYVFSNTPSVYLYPLQAGETVWCEIECVNNPNLYQVFDQNCFFYNSILTDGVINNYIFMNDYIPKNIKQIDYIKSICLMFNLMVVPSKIDPTHLLFQPRTPYFSSGIVKDWTYKVDNSTKIQQTLISEQQNQVIQLTYKADKDFYNTDYTDKQNLIYGEYDYTIDNEWIDGTKKIEVIFSPTPVDKLFGSTDIYLPKIAKRDTDTGIYGRTDFNIRFLRKNKYPKLTVNTIQLLGMAPMSVYPYCGHLDDPINPTIDYNFGSIKFAYYPELTILTPNNLVNLYWKEYLDDIADKNSKLIKLKMNLSTNDIATFNYNDIIFIDRLTDDGGHYFIVNKINYIATDNVPATVELIKIDRKPTVNTQGNVIGGPTGPIAAQPMNPIGTISLGDNPPIKSGPKIIVGHGNATGYNTGIGMVLGKNNTVEDGAQDVVLINTQNRRVKQSGTTIIRNVQFNEDGSYFTMYDLEDGGLDMVINPFSTTPYNLVEGGKDVVRGIGGVSPIMLSDSGQDTTYQGF